MEKYKDFFINVSYIEITKGEKKEIIKEINYRKIESLISGQENDGYYFASEEKITLFGIKYNGGHGFGNDMYFINGNINTEDMVPGFFYLSNIGFNKLKKYIKDKEFTEFYEYNNLVKK